MIAPEPFFEPRGTPFSEFHRIRALTALGHQVDLVTYPFGRDVSMPGLRVFRCLRPPFVRGVRIGPSLAKVPLDALLALSALRRALGARADGYDAIHSHEEGGLIGIVLAAVLRIPHLYDMHSSLPQQLTNFAFSRSAVMRRAFLAIERLMITRSRVVIVICPSLEETVRGDRPAGADRADRERPGVFRGGGHRRTGGGRPAIARPGSTVRRWCSTPARSRRTRAWICCSRRWRLCRTPRPDARLVLAGGQAGSGRSRARSCPGGGHRGRHDLCGRASGRGDSRVSARGRRAGVAALARHQHAAEDLPVSALRKADRRHAPADAHAGAERRHGGADGRHVPRVCRGHSGGADRSGEGGGDRQAGAASGRDEVQLRGLPRADTSGLRRASGVRAASGRISVSRGDPSPTPPTRTRW